MSNATAIAAPSPTRLFEMKNWHLDGQVIFYKIGEDYIWHCII